NHHRVHELRVVRPRTNNPDLDSIIWIPAGEAIEAIEPFACVQVIERALAIDLEGVLFARNIYRAPPDVVLRIWMFDHAFDFRRASGLHARVGDERAVSGDAG